MYQSCTLLHDAHHDNYLVHSETEKFKRCKHLSILIVRYHRSLQIVFVQQKNRKFEEDASTNFQLFKLFKKYTCTLHRLILKINLIVTMHMISHTYRPMYHS